MRVPCQRMDRTEISRFQEVTGRFRGGRPALESGPGALPEPRTDAPPERAALGAGSDLLARGAFTNPSGRCLTGMTNHTEDGVLVLADISGFTEFVTATELEHGPPMIAELLREVMRRLSPPLEIQEVEGDAVFAIAADRAVRPPAILLAALEEAFVAFRARQQELEADESCSCRACRSVGSLDLKIVAHHGRFLRQMVGDRRQAAGVNVVLAHRLLKNGLVGRRAYILLTEALLRWAALDPERHGLSSHTERYEHFGDVRYFVKDLRALEAWSEAVARSLA